jgi:hypothetical protein
MQADPAIEQAVNLLYEKLEHPGLEVEIKKIAAKLREAQYNPGDIQPLADCLLAILLAGKNAGFTVGMMFDALRRLAVGIQNRDWKKMQDGTFQAM